MAATTNYLTIAELAEALDIRELAQVAAAPNVSPSNIEDDLATELAGSSSSNPAAEAAEAVIQTAVDKANSLIDSYLYGHVTLPLSSVPDALKLHATRIARYELHDINASDEVRKRYEESLAWLKMVAAGTIRLADSLGEVDGASAGQISYSFPSATFTDRAITDGGNRANADYMGDL